MTTKEAATQLNYREHFYQGGLSHVVKSPIRLPPDTFRMILLTLVSYQQNNAPSTSMGIDDGAAPYFLALLEATPRDTRYGSRPAPWITPNVASADIPLTWNCVNRGSSVTCNNTLSFCPGSTVRGEVTPYLVTNP